MRPDERYAETVTETFEETKKDIADAVKDAAPKYQKLVYPHRPDLRDKKFWKCPTCPSSSYVGCKKNTDAPLGYPGNEVTRTARKRARKRAHAAFDTLWKMPWATGPFTRADAYAWLAKTLDLSPGACHIAMFDVETATRVIALANDKQAQLRGEVLAAVHAGAIEESAVRSSTPPPPEDFLDVYRNLRKR